MTAGGLELSLLRPPDAEALIDEAEFEDDEFLPYWAELWPAGLALAEALPQVCAARACSSSAAASASRASSPPPAAHGVLATDWSQDALDLLAANAARNGIALEVARVRWDEPERLAGQWELVLAADVLYEQRNVPQLLALLEALETEVLLAEPGRAPATAFFREARERWQVDEVGDRVYRLTSGPSAASSRAGSAGPA